MYSEVKVGGYMYYAYGNCGECSAKYIKRSWSPIVLTWEHCVKCDQSGFPFLHADWEDYINYMEDGAVLVSQE